VSENIIEASWIALVDGLSYKLLKDGILAAQTPATVTPMAAAGRVN